MGDGGALNQITEVAQQMAAGDARITGLKIENHLNEGRQDMLPGKPL